MEGQEPKEERHYFSDLHHSDHKKHKTIDHLGFKLILWPYVYFPRHAVKKLETILVKLRLMQQQHQQLHAPTHLKFNINSPCQLFEICIFSFFLT